MSEEENKFDVKGGVTLPGWFLTVIGGAFAVYVTFVAPNYDDAKSIATANGTALTRIETTLENSTKATEKLQDKFEDANKTTAAAIAKLTDSQTAIDRRVYALELTRDNEALHEENSANKAKIKKQSYEVESSKAQLLAVRSQVAMCKKAPTTIARRDTKPAVVTFFQDLFTPDKKSSKDTRIVSSR